MFNNTHRTETLLAIGLAASLTLGLAPAFGETLDCSQFDTFATTVAKARDSGRPKQDVLAAMARVDAPSGADREAMMGMVDTIYNSPQLSPSQEGALARKSCEAENVSNGN